MYTTVRKLNIKLSLWEMQMRQRNFSHFPCGKGNTEHASLSRRVPRATFAEKLSLLGVDFKRRFLDEKLVPAA